MTQSASKLEWRSEGRSIDSFEHNNIIMIGPGEPARQGLFLRWYKWYKLIVQRKDEINYPKNREN